MIPEKYQTEDICKKLLQDKLKEWLQEEGGAEDEI